MTILRRALLLFLVLQFAGPALARTLVRISNGEWPPYLSQHLPHYGIASRIVTEAFAVQGIDVAYGFFPWRRSLALARAGDWDGSTVWLKSADRERDFYLSDPILQADYLLFHRRDMQLVWRDMDDLAQYRIGITNDYYYGAVFHASLRKGLLKAEGVTTDEQNFRKLLGQRIDVFPVDGIVGRTLLRQRFSAAEASRITVHPKPLYSESLHLLLSKQAPGNRKLIEEFNQGLRKLKASGQLDVYLREAANQRPLAASAK